ncbi:PREDICTED: uncharacterized protein LOC108364958 [Rhagoletis zephyria]|uniref:uncharacterized protein LOC108364958 n=1 Tax=Rhagoletis zephyria TaxID=28612 RepID=UPI00081172A9|nr:PREDICTED: uncharacterized protein LOC108364958 [Rhagoletis zephyria]
MVIDQVMAQPDGHLPSFDSAEVVRGYRVVKCEDQLSKVFLEKRLASISDAWEGLRLKLIPAGDIPRRPRARIWLPRVEMDSAALLKYLRTHNREIPMDDWVILKAEESQTTSMSFLLLIGEESIEPLEKADCLLRFGIRRAKVKIFRANDAEEEEPDVVDDANKLLEGMLLADPTADPN